VQRDEHRSTDAHANDSIGVAILGSGGAARSHAIALADCPGARLVACWSRRRDAAQAFAADFACRADTDLDALLGDPTIAAVIVATEPARHDLAIPVARSGRHVLIEKPLASSLPQAAAIVNACHDAKVTASVVSQRRFEAAFERVRGYLRDDVIGAPVFVDYTLLASRTPEYFASGNGWRRGPEGGVTQNLLIHTVDRLLCLLGPVEHVQATLVPTPGPGSPDRRAAIVLAFAQGTHAVVRGSTEFETTWGDRLTITGHRGALILENGDVRLLSNPLGLETRVTRARRLALDVLLRVQRARAERPLVRQLGDFVTAIRTLGPPAVTLEDGLAALRVVLAVHESHATGRTIRLSPPLPPA